jgi:hypothetical protein
MPGSEGRGAAFEITLAPGVAERFEGEMVRESQPGARNTVGL